MITILKNDDTTAIELTDVLGEKRTVQTLNDEPEPYAFFYNAAHRVTCLAVTPVTQPVADQAQAIVTTRSIEQEKIIEDRFRVPDSRADILAAFKEAGHKGNIPVYVRRGPLTQLRDVLGRAGSSLRRSLNIRQPT